MEIKVDQGSPEWHWARKGVLTASNAGSAAGLPGSYLSRPALWRLLNGEERPLTLPMIFGLEHEEDARHAGQIAVGALSWPVGFFISDTDDWLGASPDGVFTGLGLHEIKCRPESPYETISPQHMAQIQMQLAVCGCGRCFFQSWTPDQQRIWTVPFNREYWDWLKPYLKEFWDYVVSGQEPPRLKQKRRYPNDLDYKLIYEGA
jgi:hypothetical protein